MKKKTIFKILMSALMLLIISNIFTADISSISKMFYKDGLRNYIVGNYTKAIKSFTRAKKLDPSNQKINDMIGKSYFKIGLRQYKNKKYQSAIYNFKKAKRFNSDIAGDADERIRLTYETIKRQKEIEERKRRLALIQQQRAQEQAIAARQRIQRQSQNPSGQAQNRTTNSSYANQSNASRQSSPRTGERIIITPPQTSNRESILQERRFLMELERMRNSRDNEFSSQYIKHLKELRGQEQQLARREQELMRQQFTNNNERMRQEINLLKTRKSQGFSPFVYIISTLAIVIILIFAFLYFYKLNIMKRFNEQQFYNQLAYANPGALPPINNTRSLPYMKSIAMSQQGINEDLYYDRIEDLNEEQKLKILEAIEKKIESLPETKLNETLSDIIEPLILDGNINIQNKARNMISEYSSSYKIISDEDESKELALSIPSLSSIANIIDLKTNRPNNNIIVANIAKEIACILAFDNETIEYIYKGALIRDIGYLEVEQSILNKKSTLGAKEKQLIVNHPKTGLQYLSFIDLNDIIENIIQYHHEKPDGTGYPFKIKEIPMEAQIVHIAEVYEAITGKRVYKKNQLSKEDAIKKIIEEYKNLFPDKLLDAFVKVAENIDKIYKNIIIEELN